MHKTVRFIILMMIMMTDGFKIIYARARARLQAQTRMQRARSTQMKHLHQIFYTVFSRFVSAFVFFLFSFLFVSPFLLLVSDLFICLWFWNYTLSCSFVGYFFFDWRRSWILVCVCVCVRVFFFLWKVVDEALNSFCSFWLIRFISKWIVWIVVAVALAIEIDDSD